MKKALLILLTFTSICSFSSTKFKSADKLLKKLDSCIYKTLKQRKSDIYFIEKLATIKAEALVNATSQVFIRTQYRKCKILKKEIKFFEKEELRNILLDLKVLDDENAISHDIYVYLQDIYTIKRLKNFQIKYHLKPINPDPAKDQDISSN